MGVLLIRIKVGFTVYAIAELIAIIVWIAHPTFVTMLIAWLGFLFGCIVLLVAVLASTVFRRNS